MTTSCGSRRIVRCGYGERRPRSTSNRRARGSTSHRMRAFGSSLHRGDSMVPTRNRLGVRLRVDPPQKSRLGRGGRCTRRALRSKRREFFSLPIQHQTSTTRHSHTSTPDSLYPYLLESSKWHATNYPDSSRKCGLEREISHGSLVSWLPHNAFALTSRATK